MYLQLNLNNCFVIWNRREGIATNNLQADIFLLVGWVEQTIHKKILRKIMGGKNWIFPKFSIWIQFMRAWTRKVHPQIFWAGLGKFCRWRKTFLLFHYFSCHLMIGFHSIRRVFWIKFSQTLDWMWGWFFWWFIFWGLGLGWHFY
jgi:hypothetical protein